MESNIDIESLFVNKEIAIKLKELGFNQPCFARYFRGKFQLNFLDKPYDHNSSEIDKRYVSAPLIHQAIMLSYLPIQIF